MNQQTSALYTLLRLAGLSPTQAQTLSLNDLHLAGNTPHLTVWDEAANQQRTIPITDPTRNALVSWLLARPDRPTTLLFPGEADQGLTVVAIEESVKDFLPPPQFKPQPPPPVTAHTIVEEKLPNLGPTPARQTPPPFRAAPPPGRPERRKSPLPPTPPEPDPELAATPAASPTPPPVAVNPVPETSGAAVQLTPLVPSPTQPAQFKTASLIIGGLALVACVGLIITGIVFLPDQLAARRGNTETPTAQAALPTDTPLPQPTATNTPSPEPTATVTLKAAIVSPVEPPTNTPTVEPTASSVPPTNTPTSIPPTDTPSPEPTATNTPGPQPTRTPASTNTPAPNYAAPNLIAPDPNYAFIQGNTIVLQWESVGTLAENEHYAVRLTYNHGGEIVYRGDNITETTWTIPLALYHDADGPDFKYTWYVYIEQVQTDGTGKAISPESNHREFTWN